MPRTDTRDHDSTHRRAVLPFPGPRTPAGPPSTRCAGVHRLPTCARATAGSDLAELPTPTRRAGPWLPRHTSGCAGWVRRDLDLWAALPELDRLERPFFAECAAVLVWGPEPERPIGMCRWSVTSSARGPANVVGVRRNGGPYRNRSALAAFRAADARLVREGYALDGPEAPPEVVESGDNLAELAAISLAVRAREDEARGDALCAGTLAAVVMRLVLDELRAGRGEDVDRLAGALSGDWRRMVDPYTCRVADALRETAGYTVALANVDELRAELVTFADRLDALDLARAVALLRVVG